MVSSQERRKHFSFCWQQLLFKKAVANGFTQKFRKRSCCWLVGRTANLASWANCAVPSYVQEIIAGTILNETGGRAYKSSEINTKHDDVFVWVALT
jgi:hypothetical protein